MSRAERRALVEREDPALPISRQCRLLAVSRASVYRRSAKVSDEDRAITALIDRQYLARPYYGSRRMWTIDFADRRRLPASRASSNSGGVLAFAHIPTRTTADRRIDLKGFEGRLTGASTATGADIEIGRATP